jgi:acyl transferase domain-containing protein
MSCTLQLVGGLAVQFGIFMEVVDLFDAAALGISAPEAAMMDPQQRLLMQLTAEALRTRSNSDSVTSLTSSQGLQVATASAGVFIGVSSMDYNKVVLRSTGGVTPYSATGASLSVTAGRLSYSFGMAGPAVAIDTACSSSLVAAHAALNAVQLDQCAAALTGGVNIMLSPDTPAAFQKAGMLSPDGRCKTLDASADGFARAEAAGVLLLQAVSASSSSGGLLGVVCGSAVNQDGRSSALTAPNGPAQQAVINQALKAAGMQAQQVRLPLLLSCIACSILLCYMTPQHLIVIQTCSMLGHPQQTLAAYCRSA